jgi:class 3 adenylate cyclase/tetratricopeptide (TPR) repeat protein/Mrp family chromosome partitioning ATPase
MPLARDDAPQPARESAADAVAYVPRALVESVFRHPERVSPWHERVEGTLLMGDVSGFTAMSELLARAGNEGAEWLTDIIDSFFGTMLGIASRFGGDTMTFGGDAILLLFRGDDHARRACAAALTMLAATGKLPAYKVGSHRVRLGMSMGAHSGEFFLGSAGVAESRLQCLLFGPGAARTCLAEATASSGELLITPETVAALDGIASVEALGDCSRVLEVPRSADEGPSIDVDPSTVLDRLVPYLPPQIASGLAPGAQPHAPESDHRRVCVVFINIMGVDESLAADGADVVLSDLQDYVSAVVRLADRHGGYLISNDVYTLGLKLIVGFGAPVAHEHDAANALRMVVALRCEAEKMGLRLSHRVGVNSGFVFAGDVGPSYRRQYTVMGDAVNLAARLMSAASAGQVYVSAATLEEAGAGFAADELEPITVKGKQAPIRVCALVGECTQEMPEHGSSALVGRDDEARALERAAQQAASGRGTVAVIRGEPGIGKSRLTQSLARTLAALGWTVLLGGCQAHTSGQPFAPWAEVMRVLLGIAAGDGAESRARTIPRKVRELLPGSEQWSPLLGGLLGASVPDTDAVRALKESDRRSRLFDLVAALVRAQAVQAPTALILEDLHWSDASSLALLEHVMAGSCDARVLIVATSRLEPAVAMELPADALHIVLEELPASTAVEIVSDIIGRRDLSDEMAGLLLQKARGNPLFLQEVAFSLAGSEALEGMIGVSGPELARRIAALEIPDRVQGLLMTRIDALPPRTRAVLRTAAVIGTAFEGSTLRGVLHGTSEDTDLGVEIASLVAMGLAEPEPSDLGPAFRFRHALIQEVAYDSLRFSKRRELHGRIAQYLEKAHAGDLEPLYESLVHHFSASQVDEKTREYALRAAAKARGLFAPDEAVEYYHRALRTLRARTAEATALRSLIEERVGDTYETVGRGGEAARAFRGALARWRRADRSIRGGGIALPEIADLTDGFVADLHEAALCYKIGFSYGRTYSDYDRALRWLERAQMTLPRGYPALKAKIAVAESNAWSRKGDYRRAIECGRRGLEIARRTSSRDVTAHALHILANIHYELGDLGLAARRDAQALRLYEELGDLPGQALSHSNLGSGLGALGRIDEQLEHYRVALEMHGRMGNVMEANMIDANLGDHYVRCGDFELAIDRFKGVLEACGRMPSALFLEGFACLGLARALHGLRRYEEALAALARATDVLKDAGTPSTLTEVALLRAEIEFETGRAEARRTCERALESARELGEPWLEGMGNRVLGRIAFAQGDEEGAESLMRESVSQAERMGAPYERGLALLALAELYAAWSDPAARRKSLTRTRSRAMKDLAKVGARVALDRARELDPARAT